MEMRQNGTIQTIVDSTNRTKLAAYNEEQHQSKHKRTKRTQCQQETITVQTTVDRMLCRVERPFMITQPNKQQGQTGTTLCTR